MASHENSPSRTTVAIVGAGFGGIATAIALKKQLGFDAFVIYEKSNAVGGTWRDNTYPGCSSDIPVHFYSLSTDLKDDWTRTCEFQPGILTYLQQLVSKYDLVSHIILNTKVIAAEWQADRQIYAITIQDTKSGVRTLTHAHVLVSAHGILHIPKLPATPGLDTFKGRLFHSSQWDTSLDLSGKRVAIIGNGGSASQIMPNIAHLKGINVTQFVRTRNWFIPASMVPISDGWIWAFRHIPFLTRLYRLFTFFRVELNYWLIFKSPMFRAQVIKTAERYMLKSSPEKYRNDLIPSYPIGCRRIIFDAGYLEALHRPNVALRSDVIESIVEDGIVTKNGQKLFFDVIVFATGFTIEEFPFTLRGTGPTIQEFYEEKGGPEAYLGTTVPQFPNFYMINGPNTATGYTSVLFFTEVQLKYIMKLIKPVLQRSILSVELTPDANKEYNKKIQARFTDSVFTLCASWYRLHKEGKIISIFPGSCITYWWWCRRVNWSHYKTVLPKRKKHTMRANIVVGVSTSLAVILGLAAWKIKGGKEMTTMLYTFGI